MSASHIQGVEIQPLKQMRDERGIVMHMLKCTDPWFKKFGEIYFSTINPGFVKAWHVHKKMTLHYAVPVGTIKLVLYDGRIGSPTPRMVQEIVIGHLKYCLVTIPPGVASGFVGVGEATAVVANCSDIPHDPAEIERIDPSSNTIPYRWTVQRGG